ncbi:MAG: TonB-dependent receptor [Flavobacteriales bacterium]|nr:TonB-dependent receptor [Flavobacteriales bacterium]
MFKNIVTYSILLLVYSTLNAQNNNISIKGLVWDSTQNIPIPYADVTIKSSENNEIVNATVSEEDGSFLIESTRNENIYLEVSSILGYDMTRIDLTNQPKPFVDLGKVILNPNVKLLDEVVVRREKSTVEFKLDKKVFNVGEDISSTGMGALEVLNNVPSVNVDLEGNITLRGNSGVQILIDGKPSVLADEGGKALASITADMIESIEIITNPSAKYEAEGTSGILNIILKKNKKDGINGSISVNTGIPGDHSIGVSLNKRSNKFNLFTQFGVGYEKNPRYIDAINDNFLNNTKLKSNSEGSRNEQFYNITLGSDYYLNDLNTITLSGRFAYEIEDENSDTNFRKFNSIENSITNWERKETTNSDNPKWEFDLQYKKQFKNNKDHVLLFSAQGNFFGKVKKSDFLDTSLEGKQNTYIDFHQANYNLKADYTNPLTDEIKLETGSVYNIIDIGNDFQVRNLVDDIWELDASFSNNFKLSQKVLGIYSTASYEKDKWGFKAGIRLENTDLETHLQNTNTTNRQQYTNWFPSFHSSYKFSKAFSVQAGYSKRIFRPRMWDLNPFFSFSNNFNLRVGNPNLEPQYANSYELTGILSLQKLSLSSSVYNLYTTNVIEWITSYENEVSTNSPTNIGTNNKTGVSINGKYNATKWLTLHGDFDYGWFNRDANYNNIDYSFSNNQWSSKLTSKFKLPAKFDLETTFNYNSKYETVQGKRAGFYVVNIGIRKKIINGKLVLNLNINDLFETRRYENFVNQENYSIYTRFQRGRFIKFGISYGFGKGEAVHYSGG